MTPRQISAYLFLAQKRRLMALCENLGISALAAHADGKTLKSQLDRWDSEIP